MQKAPGTGHAELTTSGLPTERRALTWLALAAVVGILWVALPVAVGVLLGVLMAFTAQPLFESIQRRTGRRRLAALVTVVLSALAIVIVVGGCGYLFVTKGVVLVKRLVDTASAPGATAGVLAKMEGPLRVVGVSEDTLAERVRSALGSVAAGAAVWAERIAAATASALLALFLAVLTMNIVLPRWNQMALWAQRTLPIRPAYTRELFVEFRRIGRATLLGTVATGIAQGVFAAIGYFIAGVPEPVFFGVATAVASLVPAVGTLMVWVPMGVVLIASGHVLAGVFVLIWGLAVIGGVSDYVLRPRLVGGEQYPTIVTFVALFGGVEVFGLEGLIVGPLIMALGVAILRIYSREAQASRAVESS